MKSLQLIRLKAIFKLLFLLTVTTSFVNGFFTDISLPKIVGVKAVVDRNSVGFEWKSIARYANVTSINVYRAVAKPGIKQVYVKIDSISNRFATHYVDNTVRPNTKYFYTFTTASGLSESMYGDIVPVKTQPPYKPIKVVEAKEVDKGVVKILWVPSSEVTVTKYIIQRRKSTDNRWYYLQTVKGRLYPEYIDSTPQRGNVYLYRVFARDANDMTSLPSNEVKVEVK